TGLNRESYKENRNFLPAIMPFAIEVGTEHILAVHIVDYVARLQPRFLKTGALFNNFSSQVVLTGPSCYTNTTALISQRRGYLFLYSGIIGLLTVLFWVLHLQNRRDKNLLYISNSTSFFFAWALLITIIECSPNLDFDTWWLLLFLAIQYW